MFVFDEDKFALERMIEFNELRTLKYKYEESIVTLIRKVINKVQ